MKRRWPNLFIVGSAKTGKSLLADVLVTHSAIFMSSLREPHFFSDANPALTPGVTSMEEYLRLFERAAAERWLGEESASYLEETVAARIRRVVPDARIVVMLRDPVKRAVAHYWQDVRYGVETRSFADAVASELEGRPRPAGTDLYLRRGFYSAPLRIYMELFPAAVLPIFFEDLLTDFQRETTRVWDFLEIEPVRVPALQVRADTSVALPRGGIPRALLASPRARAGARRLVPRALRHGVERRLLRNVPQSRVDAELLSTLRTHFDHDRRRLELLVGRPVPWSGSDPGAATV